MGLALAAYVYISTTQVREALAAEIIEQQHDVASLLYEYSGVMISLERYRRNKNDSSKNEVTLSLGAADEQLQKMRSSYSFTNLDGATKAHAFIKPVLEDTNQWLTEGVNGYGPNETIVLYMAAMRLHDRYPALRKIADDTDSLASSLITEQSTFLENFRNSLISLLAAFALFAFGIAALLIRQRNLQAQIAISSEQNAHKLIEAETRGREQAETALQGSEQFLRATLNALPSNIAILNNDGTIVATNKPWDEFVYSKEPALADGGIGAPFQSILQRTATTEMEKEGSSSASRMVQDVLSGVRDSMNHEYPCHTPEKQQWVVTSTSTFYTGAEKHAVLVREDVTDRKKLEERDRRLRAELAHTSRLTTAGELASGLAHELNQPLTAISHNCDAILSSTSDESSASGFLKQALHDIYEQSQRAGSIIRSMRHLVRKDTTDMVPTDINTLVRETLRLTQPEAREKNVIVNLKLSDYLPTPNIDPVQIQQVLVNLERNSVEAMGNSDNSARILTITTACDGAGNIQISVQDTGPGIAPDVRSRLFTAFQTTKADGMGLGLSICRNIVEAHGGRLWSDDKVSPGTVFHFTLPFAKL